MGLAEERRDNTHAFLICRPCRYPLLPCYLCTLLEVRPLPAAQDGRMERNKCTCLRTSDLKRAHPSNPLLVPSILANMQASQIAPPLDYSNRNRCIPTSCCAVDRSAHATEMAAASPLPAALLTAQPPLCPGARLAHTYVCVHIYIYTLYI